MTAQKRKELLKRLGSLLVGTLIALVVGEVAVRIVASQSLIYNIEMVRYAKELKEPDPQGQISHVHRTNASAHLMGVDIALNSLGHRSPELAPQKDPHKKRVFVLGSSVTMGWGVDDGKVFTSLVKDRFEKERPQGPDVGIELANAGIGNYNTIAQSVLFARQYPVVKPDLVVLHYFISDPEPRPPGKNSLLLRHSYFAAYLYDRFRTIGLAAEGKTDLFKYYSEIYDDKNPYWTDTLNRISAMRDAAAKDHVPFLIMLVPDFHNLAKDTPYGALYAKMEKGFTERGINTVNTFTEFQKRYGGNESALWIKADDPHPNALGHELMAELLYDYLAKPGAFTLDNLDGGSRAAQHP
jgi:lysophospholipase L1-like esterase